MQLWGGFSLGGGRFAMENNPALSQEVREVWSGDSRRLPSGAGERHVGRSAEKPLMSENQRVLTQGLCRGQGGGG